MIELAWLHGVFVGLVNATHLNGLVDVYPDWALAGSTGWKALSCLLHGDCSSFTTVLLTWLVNGWLFTVWTELYVGVESEAMHWILCLCSVAVLDEATGLDAGASAIIWNNWTAWIVLLRKSTGKDLTTPLLLLVVLFWMKSILLMEWINMWFNYIHAVA